MEIHVKYLQSRMLHITAFVKKAGFDIPGHFLSLMVTRQIFPHGRQSKLCFSFLTVFAGLEPFD